MARGTNCHNPAFIRNRNREPKSRKKQPCLDVILESVVLEGGKRGYYHCHIQINGVRTDVMATYDPVKSMVFLEPAHARDKMPYYISQLTERSQKKLCGKIEFYLSNLRDEAVLRETNYELAFPFVIPLTKDTENEYRRRRNAKSKNEDAKKDNRYARPQIYNSKGDTNQRRSARGIGAMLSRIEMERALEGNRSN